MSRGKYLNLPEARKKKQLDRFATEHPSEGDGGKLDELIGKMARTPESGDQTSSTKNPGED
jgi:hypothetical protein